MDGDIRRPGDRLPIAADGCRIGRTVGTGQSTDYNTLAGHRGRPATLAGRCGLEAHSVPGKSHGVALRYTAGMPRKQPASPTDPSPVADFEASLEQLEALVERMESGEMSLDDSLAAYERGVGLYRRCQAALEQAELRVRLLSDPQDPASVRSFSEPGHPAVDDV